MIEYIILIGVALFMSSAFAVIIHIDTKLSRDPKKSSNFRVFVTGAIIGFLIVAVYIRISE